MIIVEGTAKLAAGEIERLRPVLQRMAAETVEVAGCHSYGFAVDVADPTLLRIVEKWSDDASLTGHFAAPHMAAFNEAFAAARIEAVSVNAYSAEFARTLLGE